MRYSAAPLDPDALRRLRALNVRVGEKRGREMLDLARNTYMRLMAGLPVRQATAEVVRLRLEDLDRGNGGA